MCEILLKCCSNSGRTTLTPAPPLYVVSSTSYAWSLSNFKSPVKIFTAVQEQQCVGYRSVKTTRTLDTRLDDSDEKCTA